MKAPIKVGDICILQNGVVHPEFNGEEVIVVDSLKVRDTLQSKDRLCYLVESTVTGPLAPTAHQLRKRDEPDEESHNLMLECLNKAKERVTCEG